MVTMDGLRGKKHFSNRFPRGFWETEQQDAGNKTIEMRVHSATAKDGNSQDPLDITQPKV